MVRVVHRELSSSMKAVVRFASSTPVARRLSAVGAATPLVDHVKTLVEQSSA